MKIINIMMILMICVFDTFATTFYVSKTGSNIFPYTTPATAARDISDTLTLTTYGDTVIVSNGTYNISVSLICEKDVTLKSVNGKEVTIIKGSGNNQVLFVSNSKVDGFTIQNGKVVLVQSSKLMNCDITGCTDQAISSDHSTIQGCEISSNSSSKNGAGIKLDSSTILNCIVENNTSTGCGGGISVIGIHQTIIRNCIIRSNTSSGDGGGVYIQDTSTISPLILNSVFYSNSSISSNGGAIYVGTHCDIVNCTIVDNTAINAGGLYSYNDGKSINNIIYNNNATSNPNWDNYGIGMSYSNTLTSPITGLGSGCIDSSPTFVNASIRDYQLAIGSVGIDIGMNVSSYTVIDIDYNLRPLDGNNDSVNGYDMGAYECFNPNSDTDGDGMSDGWEKEHNLEVMFYDAYENPDGDGQNNLTEFILDTDPNAVSDPFLIGIDQTGSMISWSTSSNRYYSVQSNTNLVSDSWKYVDGCSNMIGTGSIMQRSMNDTETSEFYRVLVHVN